MGDFVIAVYHQNNINMLAYRKNYVTEVIPFTEKLIHKRLWSADELIAISNPEIQVRLRALEIDENGNLTF